MNRAAFVTFGLAGALALGAAPAFAQHHRDGGGERRDSAQQQAQPRQESRGGGEYRAVPREEYNRRNAAPNAGPRYQQRYEPRYTPRYNSAPRYYSGRYYGPRYVGPRFSIAPRRFYRPYYVFRPRFSIGFGIWSGYPVTYYDPFYY